MPRIVRASAFLLLTATALAETPPVPPRKPETTRPATVDPPHPPRHERIGPETIPVAPPANPGALCLAALQREGHAVEPAEAPKASESACTLDTPVRISAIRTATGTVQLPDRPLLSCAFAADVVDFVQDLAAPLAQAVLGSSLAKLGTGPGYDCRTRNRVPGAKISAHGQGRAIDIATLETAARKSIAVSARLTGVDAAYVSALRKAACGWFNTTLGPGSDPAHADHLHFDDEPRGRDGQSRFCQ